MFMIICLYTQLLDEGKLSDKVKIITIYLPENELDDYLDEFNNEDEVINNYFDNQSRLAYSSSASAINDRLTSTPVHRRNLRSRHSSTLPEGITGDFLEMSCDSVDIDTSTTDTNSVDRTSYSEYMECDGSSQGSTVMPILSSGSSEGNILARKYSFDDDKMGTDEENGDKTEIGSAFLNQSNRVNI